MDIHIRLHNVDPVIQPAIQQAFDIAQGQMQHVCNEVQLELRKLRTENNQLKAENAALKVCDEVQVELRKLRTENNQLKAENAALKGVAPQNGALRMTQGVPSNSAVVGNPAQGLGDDTYPYPANNQAVQGEGFDFVCNITIHDAPVHCVSSPSKGRGDLIATASWDTSVKIYSLSAASVIASFSTVDGIECMGGLYSVAFAKTEPSIIGCTSSNNNVYLFDWERETFRLKLRGHTNEVNCIDFHTSQQIICTASDDKKALVWDFHVGIQVRTLDAHTQAVYGAVFLGEEHNYCVATCSFDQTTRIWDMRDKKITQQFKDHSEDVIGIDYSSPKRLLATGSDDGAICVYDLRQVTTRSTPLYKMFVSQVSCESSAGHPTEAKRVAFSNDGGLLAAACSSGEVLVYDMDACAGAGGNPRPAARLGTHTDCVFDVAWSVCPQTNASILVSASHDNTCKYWRSLRR